MIFTLVKSPIICYRDFMLPNMILIILLSLNFYASASVPQNIIGENLLTAKPLSVPTKFNDKKGLVLIFMSAKCPCSDSHIPVIKKLSAQYEDFKFAVIHSNLDESKDAVKKYFKTAALPFEVIKDYKTKIADEFQAYKTPHAFVISPAGEILYQGGVTNSSHAPSADEFFLANALADIAANKKVRVTEGRTLGCVILRENEIRVK